MEGIDDVLNEIEKLLRIEVPPRHSSGRGSFGPVLQLDVERRLQGHLAETNLKPFGKSWNGERKDRGGGGECRTR